MGHLLSLLCVCIHMWGRRGQAKSGMVFMWRSEDSFVELVFTFHLSVGSGDLIQVVRLAWLAPEPGEPPYSSPWGFLKRV